MSHDRIIIINFYVSIFTALDVNETTGHHLKPSKTSNDEQSLQDGTQVDSKQSEELTLSA